MSLRCQTGAALWASLYQGLGATGAIIKALPEGTHGYGIGANDGLLDAADYYFRVTTPPAGGTLRLYERGDFDQTVVGDGGVPWAYRLYENGVAQGSGPTVVDVVVGAPVGVTMTVTGLAATTITAVGVITASIGTAPAFIYGRAGPFTRVPTQEEQGVGLLGRYTKQPVEVLDFPVDFTDWMKGRVGDSISSYTIASNPSGLTPEVSAISGKVVTAVWSGGVAGDSYRVTTTITTAAGLVKSAEYQLTIKEI